MLVSGTSAASCDGLIVSKYEDKEKCSGEGVPDAGTLTYLKGQLDTCQQMGDKNMMTICTEKGMEMKTYSDKECKEVIDFDFKYWNTCYSGYTMKIDESAAKSDEKSTSAAGGDDETTSAAQFLKVAIGSLVIGAVSYMA